VFLGCVDPLRFFSQAYGVISLGAAGCAIGFCWPLSLVLAPVSLLGMIFCCFRNGLCQWIGVVLHLIAMNLVLLGCLQSLNVLAAEHGKAGSVIGKESKQIWPQKTTTKNPWNGTVRPDR
jgi:hypothetical protein